MSIPSGLWGVVDPPPRLKRRGVMGWLRHFNRHYDHDPYISHYDRSIGAVDNQSDHYYHNIVRGRLPQTLQRDDGTGLSSIPVHNLSPSSPQIALTMMMSRFVTGMMQLHSTRIGAFKRVTYLSASFPYEKPHPLDYHERLGQ